MNIAMLIAKEPSGRMVPSRWPIAAPAAGSAMTSQARANTPSAGVGSTTGMPPSWSANISESCVLSGSVLQQAGVVDRGRPAGAEDRHDDREADHDLRGGDDHHEERGDL